MTLIPVSDCGVPGGRNVRVNHPSSALPLGADLVVNGLVRAIRFNEARCQAEPVSRQDRREVVIDETAQRMIDSGVLN